MKALRPLFFIFLISLVSPGFSSEGNLLLIDKDKQIELPVEELRNQAKTEFTIFAPFHKREVHMRGLLLETLLAQHLGKIPERIKLIAIDGYEVSLEDWQKNHWLVVTHEDDQPLSIRQRGPLRIVERDYGNKDPDNLRNFTDWIWMLQRIEAL